MQDQEDRVIECTKAFFTRNIVVLNNMSVFITSIQRKPGHVIGDSIICFDYKEQFSLCRGELCYSIQDRESSEILERLSDEIK